MSLRICLVSPFSWSRPSEVNEHVAGVAAALRARGHRVTVVAPSNRAADLAAGRRALARGLREEDELVAVSPGLPAASGTDGVGLPVGVRANLTAALLTGGFDVVHGFEPALPSLSYLALLDAETFTVATFVSPERLGYPPRKAQRDRLMARIDALLALSPETAAAAEERFPGAYRVVPAGVDLELFAPVRKRPLIAVEVSQNGRAAVRAVLRSLRDLDGWEIDLVRTTRLAARPSIPHDVRPRVRVRTARRPEARAAAVREAAIAVPAPGGSTRFRLGAMAAGCALAEPPAAEEQPALVAAAVARLAEDAGLRDREAGRARAEALEQSFDHVASVLEDVYTSVGSRRRERRRDGDPLASRDWIEVDLHMHTAWSHDCSIPVPALLDHAEAIGLGAIAVTDHNVFGGAAEAVALAQGRELVVIPGEEVKTDGQGEVIGLFLRHEIPRGMSFADTIAAIREQDGIVYVPHPFDRLHAIPGPATLHRHLADIDVFEVYNARLPREAFNDEALRFARKYRLLQGAGSDAHVLQGVGTGALRMRRFDGPEEFLLSLRTAEVLRRPRSLAVLQSLKWVAQVKEKVR